MLRVDRFGNLVSNFESNEFQKVASTPFELRAGEHRITQYRTDYVSAEPGELFLISGSSGFLEVSLNQGDASKQIQIIAGAVIQLSFDKGDAVRGTGTVSIP